MADKNAHRIAEDGSIFITLTGLVKGEFRVPSTGADANGMIFLATVSHPTTGNFVALKIRASEHPDLVAAMDARAKELAAQDAARYAGEAGQRAIDAKMAAAGFEAAGNAGELANKLNPIKGENF